jgi:metallo-beta-lactamase family protein
LLAWFSALAPLKPRVVLTHGEDGPRQMLAEQIQKRFKIRCDIPQMMDVIEL